MTGTGFPGPNDMKRNTANRRPQHRNVLEVRVISPRIAWIGLTRFLGVLGKLAILAALLGAAGWGVWRGVHHAFHQNPDFALKFIDMNPNPVIDEAGMIDMLGIDLADCPSLFEINAGKAGEKLRALPAVTGARVERHLPGTLVVRIEVRKPQAWLRCQGDERFVPRTPGGVLVDDLGVAYHCPEKQLEQAAALPVIEFPAAPPAIGRKVVDPALDHCLRLLDAARAADPDAARWIDSIRHANEWSLEVVTREGTRATFGLDDHERQMQSLRDALDHAVGRGYDIETINLIPKYNIPITLRGESAPPRAIIIEPSSTDDDPDRPTRDLGVILNPN